MTNYAEDICRILHMAKVFPCLLPMGKTDNNDYTRNNDKITLFISLIHELQTIKQTNIIDNNKAVYPLTYTLVINFDKTAIFYLFISGSYIPALQDQRFLQLKASEKQFKTCVKSR